VTLKGILTFTQTTRTGVIVTSHM